MRASRARPVGPDRRRKPPGCRGSRRWSPVGIDAALLAASAAKGLVAHHAKMPEVAFKPDGVAKRQAASEAIRLAVEQRLRGVHQRIEAARLGRPAP